MDYTVLGRTGLEVSIVGLGCGGHSRLGQAYGKTTNESMDLVRAALDLGISFVDTAPVYGTEEVVGGALVGLRHKAVISTKTPIMAGPEGAGPPPLTGALVLQTLETSLARLKTDYVDVYHVHAVSPHQLAFVNAEIVPALLRARDQGKVRYLGITEAFGAGDSRHDMLRQAIKDDVWDVMMVGFNLLNPSAKVNILPQIRKKNLGAIAMFAVPRTISDPQALHNAIGSGAGADQVGIGNISSKGPAAPSADNLTNAAYRYCRHESGMDIILTGTGSVGHLRQNIASILGDRLPYKTLHQLNALQHEASQ